MFTKWYIIKVLSGYEEKVISLIKETITKRQLHSYFIDFVVPIENTIEVKKGKRVNLEKRIFPGYIMAHMLLNDLTWSIVKNTQYVGKLLGCSNIPASVPEHQVKRVLRQVEEGKIAREQKKSFEIGENVKIVNGVFETFNGLVEEVEDDKQRLKVLVSIFGRETPVELNFDQVEKNI